MTINHQPLYAVVCLTQIYIMEGGAFLPPPSYNLSLYGTCDILHACIIWPIFSGYAIEDNLTAENCLSGLNYKMKKFTESLEDVINFFIHFHIFDGFFCHLYFRNIFFNLQRL